MLKEEVERQNSLNELQDALISQLMKERDATTETEQITVPTGNKLNTLNF